MNSTPARAALCIWTGIAPEAEADFNRWYDREHMQERIAIPGFRFARRFKALGNCPQPYLALYVTNSLAVFTSAAYRQAFTSQTEWSLKNFGRMQGTQRRVGELAIETGGGEGAYLSLFVLPAAKACKEDLAGQLHAQLQRTAELEQIVSATLLHTRPELSVSLTGAAAQPPADGLVMVEGSHRKAVEQAARALASALGEPEEKVWSFQMLWRLGA